MAFTNAVKATQTGIQTISSTGIWTGTTVTNHSILIGSTNNGITSLGVATNGQLVIGSTGADPVIASLTAGSGISITPGAGSLTIAATGTFAQDYTQSFLLGGM